jgi:hypothetical protein
MCQGAEQICLHEYGRHALRENTNSHHQQRLAAIEPNQQLRFQNPVIDSDRMARRTTAICLQVSLQEATWIM